MKKKKPKLPRNSAALAASMRTSVSMTSRAEKRSKEKTDYFSDESDQRTPFVLIPKHETEKVQIELRELDSKYRLHIQYLERYNSDAAVDLSIDELRTLGSAIINMTK